MDKNLLAIRNALIATIVFFAVTHLIILAFQALYFRNIATINIFSILGISSLLPQLSGTTVMATVSSLLVIAIVFVFAYLLTKKRV